MNFVTQYISPVAYAIGWFVTGLGWFVTHHHAGQRESRKEMRTNVDRFINTLNELVKIACDYYTAHESEERKSLEITILVDQCNRQIEDFGKLNNPPKFNNKFTDLYEAITGGDFGSNTRTLGADKIEKCKRISILNGKIIELLENWYREEYPIKSRK